MAREAFQTKKGSTFWFHPQQLALVTDKTDPLYDHRVEMEPNESLVRNMMYNGQGVLEPVIITKRIDPETGEAVPVVVDGRQRTKAARIVCERLEGQGLKPMMVPCVYRKATDEALYSIMVSANEQRTDDSPIDKATKVSTMLNFGQSWEDVCDTFGVSKQTAKGWLDLLELPKEERDAVHTRKLPVKVAKKRAKVKKENPTATAAEVDAVVNKGKSAERDTGSNATGARRRLRTLKEVTALRENIADGSVVMDVEQMFTWLLHEGGE